MAPAGGAGRRREQLPGQADRAAPVVDVGMPVPGSGRGGWTPADRHGQFWNVGPAHGPQCTVLDDSPTTTDLPEASACPLRAR